MRSVRYANHARRRQSVLKGSRRCRSGRIGTGLECGVRCRVGAGHRRWLVRQRVNGQDGHRNPSKLLFAFDDGPGCAGRRVSNLGIQYLRGRRRVVCLGLFVDGPCERGKDAVSQRINQCPILGPRYPTKLKRWSVRRVRAGGARASQSRLARRHRAGRRNSSRG